MAERSDVESSEVTVDIMRIERNDLGELSARMSVLQAQRLDPDFVAIPCSIDEAIKNGAAPIPLSSDKTLDIQRVVDVMDHFLTCEATWHGGADLEQTVFSCIYLREPSRLSPHALLHSFFGVARMTCNAVSSVLLIENLENDEEFSNGVSLQMLQGVEENISRQLKACTAPLSKNRLFEGVEPLQTNPDLEEDFCNAVLCRLRFRKHFYHMLTCLRRTQGKGLDLGKKHIDSCLNELDSMLKSEEFLRSCTVSKDRVEHKKTTASGSQPLGFDYLSRPHTIELRSWKEAINYFQKLLHDLKIICSNSLSLVLEDALCFVVYFHKFRPLPFARASIQLMLVQDGRLYGCEPIFVIICKAALLPKRANSHDIQKLKTVAELGTLLIKLLRALCTDVESQRREHANIILDWRRILPQLNTDFRHAYGDPTRFSSDQHKFNVQMCKHILVWVEEQKLWTALRYLLLGFDTDAYSPSEYCMTYWYIYMILIKLAEKIMLKTSLKNESIKRKTRTKRGSANNMDEESEVPPQVLLLKCYTRVAEGLIAILGILRTKHKLFVCPSEEQRFSLNFSALKEGVGYWPEVSYKMFKESTSRSRFSDKSLGEHDSFDKAQIIVNQLKVKYGNDAVRLDEVEQLNIVAVRNRVTFNFLRLLGTLDESITFSLEFDQHPHFAVATMDPSKSLRLLNINAS